MFRSAHVHAPASIIIRHWVTPPKVCGRMLLLTSVQSCRIFAAIAADRDTVDLVPDLPVLRVVAALTARMLFRGRLTPGSGGGRRVTTVPSRGRSMGAAGRRWPVRPSGSPWAWRAAPAEGEAFGAPDEIDEHRPGLEGERAVDGAGEHGRGAWGEAELVGAAAAGKGVETQARVSRLP